MKWSVWPLGVFYRILPPVCPHERLLLVPNYHVLLRILSIVLGTGFDCAVSLGMVCRTDVLRDSQGTAEFSRED